MTEGGCECPPGPCQGQAYRAQDCRLASADAPSPDVETVLAVIRAHRRNEVIEPDHANDLPIRTRIKCDSDECDWYEVHDRWYEAVAAHEAHVAAALRGAGLPEPNGEPYCVHCAGPCFHPEATL